MFITYKSIPWYIFYLVGKHFCLILVLYFWMFYKALCMSRRLRWTGHVAGIEEGRSAFKILKSIPTGTRPLGRPRRRWEDNIRMLGIGLIRLRIWIIGKPLWMPHWTSRFHKPWSELVSYLVMSYSQNEEYNKLFENFS